MLQIEPKFDIRQKQLSFSYHRIQTGSWAYPVSYSMGIGAHFPGIKLPGREDDLSSSFSVEVKNAWSSTSTLPYVFMAQGQLYPYF
jgi:hypothetical protein